MTQDPRVADEIVVLGLDLDVVNALRPALLDVRVDRDGAPLSPEMLADPELRGRPPIVPIEREQAVRSRGLEDVVRIAEPEHVHFVVEMRDGRTHDAAGTSLDPRSGQDGFHLGGPEEPHLRKPERDPPPFGRPDGREPLRRSENLDIHDVATAVRVRHLEPDVTPGAWIDRRGLALVVLVVARQDAVAHVQALDRHLPSGRRDESLSHEAVSRSGTRERPVPC